MKEQVRIWKLPGWLLKHFREAQGFSSPRKTVLYSALLFSGVALFMLFLNTLGSTFGLMLVTVVSLTFLGTLLVLTSVMHFFRVIAIRKECYDCQFGFYVIAHELNHVRLNALNDGEELVDREAQKQVGEKFFPLLLSDPVLCKNCAFRKKKYRAAAEAYASGKL